MANVYDLSVEFSGDLFTQNPFWVLMVVRFKHNVTYDRTLRDSISVDSMEEYETPLIITSCSQLQISSSKNSHNQSLIATLQPDLNYLSEILPGDWLLAWIVEGDDKYQTLLKDLRAKRACNQFNSGLKFVGKVSDCRKRSFIRPETGVFESFYTLSAHSFTELDYMVNYRYELLKSDKFQNTQIMHLGILMSDIVAHDKNSPITDDGLIDPNLVLPALVRVLTGKGAYNDPNTPHVTGVDGREIQASANGIVRVPSTVFKALGQTGDTYVDILQFFLGTEHFDQPLNEGKPWELVLPALTVPAQRIAQGPHFYNSGAPLIGQFATFVPPYDNVPAWEVIRSFTNAPLNEMYTALRPDPKTGALLPTLSVRQMPFTTEMPIPPPENLGIKTQAVNERSNTRFLELPRWKIADPMIWTSEVGRSDALRFNYIHVAGNAGISNPLMEQGKFLLSPPIWDKKDIERFGIRPWNSKVNCTFVEATLAPQYWRNIFLDIFVGQHFTFTGTIATAGVTAPIAVGDNLEYNDVVYHLEQITHNCGIDPQGNKSFQTIMQVSNGRANESLIQSNLDSGKTLSESMYVALRDSNDREDDSVLSDSSTVTENKYED